MLFENDIKQVVRKLWRHGIRAKNRTAECASCFDEVTIDKVLRAPCKHNYCLSCLAVLVNESIKDESRFPMRCCKKDIPTGRIINRLDDEGVKRNLLSKRREYATPQTERLYCPAKDCSTFLGGSSSFAMRGIACPECGTVVCKWCGQCLHRGRPCAEDDVTEAVRIIAKREGWQTCPGCTAVVQKLSGCNSIVRRCGVNFCYVCGKKIKLCRHGQCINVR